MRALLSTFAAAFAILAAQQALAAPSHLSVAVPDMECEACSQTLLHNLRAEPTITEARADLAQRTIFLRVREGAHLSGEHLRDMVRTSGFTPGTVRLGAQ